MRQFWEKGFGGTSVADLTEAMGITPPSLYAAFGDKDALYREAVDHYEARFGGAKADVLGAEPTAREAIARVLTLSAAELAAPGHPAGCMVALAAANCPAAETPTGGELQRRRAALSALFRQRIDRGVAEGDVPPGTDTGALAAFFVTVYFGMSLRARDGAPPEELVQTATLALRAWPEGKG